ncbi:MAG: YicC family protein [Gammaproteobacteria bacterium]|nr:YicC family protein [Gammaproteobacteria bacterium]MDH5593841.1 YicC family protein [Gammaproteobacteria bacterium]
MIRSMTAFGRQSRQWPWGTLVWEVKSVNHRYLEISTRMPDDFRALEMRIRTLLGKLLGRGKVDCALRFQKNEVLDAEITINAELAKQIAAASREVDSYLYSAAPVNSMDVLRWPGVLHTPEMNMEELHNGAMELLEETIDELVDTRLREGEKLKQIIEQRLSAMRDVVLQVKDRVPEVLVQMREKLEARLEEIKTEVDPARVEQELVMLTQRLDVDEEMDRLETHIEEVSRVIESDEPIGRRLDFLMQELNREANTLGSKSQDTEMTKASVELKVLIEQMREQVQNIE